MKTHILEKIQGLKLVTENSNLENDITGVYIGDLLSLVMSKAKEGNIWITIQTHLNVVAVSELLELSAVIVVEGLDVENDMIIKANETGLPVFKTNKSAYEMAKIFSEMKI